MITVKITNSSISMSGHVARKDPNGIDQAYAAVSALTCTLINFFRYFLKDISP